MKKMLEPTKIMALLLMALVLTVIPLAGIACSSDEDEAPVAAFTATPTSGPPTLNVTFTDQSTGGEITQWEWNFGDGGTSNEQSPSHGFAEEGSYDVSLTVTGPGGTDTLTKTGYIEVAGFIADFTADKTIGTYAAGGTVAVQFTDKSTSLEEVTAWEWNFGDGETSTEQNPSHVYDGAVKRYDVSLTITSAEGTKTGTKNGYILTLPDEWQNMNITFQAPFATTDVTSLVCDKFAALLDQYTDGNVNLDMYYNETLVKRGQMFEALQAHQIGGALINAGDCRAFDSNLDFSGQLQGLVISAEHAEAVYANEVYKTFIKAQWGSHDIHYVGYVPTYLIFTYFANNEIDSLWDLAGTKIYYGKTGELDPAGKYLGIAEQAFVYPWDLKTAVQGGQVSSQATPPGLALTLFNSPAAFDDVLLRPFYNVNHFVFDDKVWGDMEGNLQTLIEEIIMPEVKGYADIVDPQSQANDIQGVLDLMSTAHVETCKEEEDIWQGLKDYPAFLSYVSGMNTEIYDLFVELRPQYTDFDPIVKQILDQLTFEGAPIPYSNGY